MDKKKKKEKKERKKRNITETTKIVPFSKGHNSKSKLYRQKYMKEKKGRYQFLLKWLTAYE